MKQDNHIPPIVKWRKTNDKKTILKVVIEKIHISFKGMMTWLRNDFSKGNCQLESYTTKISFNIRQTFQKNKRWGIGLDRLYATVKAIIFFKQKENYSRYIGIEIQKQILFQGMIKYVAKLKLILTT